MILYGQLAEDTARWRASGDDRALLYRGVQLAATRQAARVWDADPGRYPALSTSEAEFLRASGRALARGRWRRRALAGLLAVLVIAALAGAGIAVKNARTTRRPAEHHERLATPGRAEHRPWTPPIRSRPRCWPEPPGGWPRPRRPGTACSSRWPSPSAAS